MDKTIAIDTSVALALLVANHPHHRRTSEWAQGRKLALCAHSLVETFSVLTRLPGDNRVEPETATALIDGAFPEVLTLEPDNARNVHRKLADAGIRGGAAYDGLIAITAVENGVTLASLDRRAVDTYFGLGAVVELIPS